METMKWQPGTVRNYLDDPKRMDHLLDALQQCKVRNFNIKKFRIGDHTIWEKGLPQLN